MPSGARRARAPSDGDVWVELCPGPLPVEEARRWVTLPHTGAVVVFTGVVRDHSAERAGVTSLTYEAWDDQAVPALRAVADEARERWGGLGRVALIHRTGDAPLSEETVVVAVSAPHRGEAFDAARFCIDTLKERVPIWKREHGARDSGWARGQELRSPAPATSPEA